MRRLILLLNCLAPLAALVIWGQGWSWAWIIGTLMFAHALWLWATLVPSSNWWGPQVQRLPSGGRSVWITIDDGPDPEDTPRLLDLLDHHGAKATFFVIGSRAVKHPDLVRLILARGHEIGNHTFHHSAGWFWFFGGKRVGREIRQCSEILKEIAPKIVLRWFRAPAGLRNHHVHPVLEKEGLKLVGWSVRGRDGVSQNLELIKSRLRGGIKDGAILLMHEGRVAPNGERLAPQVLADLLKELQKANYEATLPTF
jgi:peptidoglycan-N-acetylglucosamine deacetylase